MRLSRIEKIIATCLVIAVVYVSQSEEVSNLGMQNIYNQVAHDAVERYKIAKRQGDATQICVEAAQVSASYLQAKDETNYVEWKNIEKEDCRKAGMP